MKLRSSARIVGTYLFHLFLCLLLFNANKANEITGGPRYFHTPMHEVLQHALYIKTTQHDEIVVAYTDKGSDLRENDYLTHADGVRILNGGLHAFLKSGDKEAIVPIIEESEMQHGGSKFIGFVLMQVVQPRKLSTRRGEIVFDLEEGGPPPTMNLGNIVVTSGGAKTTSDPSYQSPPHGTGACITGKDCYFFNGTCVGGQCVCQGVYTGTYCQLNRPDMAAAAIMKKRTQTLQQKQNEKKQEQQSNKPRIIPNNNDNNNMNKNMASNANNKVSTDEASDSSNMYSGHNNANEGISDIPTDNANQNKEKKKKKKKKPASSQASSTAGTDSNSNFNSSEGDRINTNNETPRNVADINIPDKISDVKDRNNNINNSNNKKSPSQQSELQNPKVTVLGDANGDNLQFANVKTVEDLYGDSPKRFPQPNAAGRLPNAILNDRHRLRNSKTRFVYAVRFRVGPFGLVFDNKPNNMTVVESVVKGGQSEQSDVKPGDRLVAIDTFDLSRSPAKTAQRILSSLSWPVVLAFETHQLDGTDPQTLQIQQRQATFNMTVLYPPHLTGEYQFRTASWAPVLQLMQTGGGQKQCPVFRLKAPPDLFGCPSDSSPSESEDSSSSNGYFAISDYEQQLIQSRGFVDAATETQVLQSISQPSSSGAFRFLALLLQESFVRKTHVSLRSAAIAKRGVCTFVEKATYFSREKAHLGLVVNTDNELLAPPAGKSDNTQEVNAPFGLLRNSDGLFLHLSSLSQDVFFVLKPSSELDTDHNCDRHILDACELVAQASEDILDRWPHAVPDLSLQQILAYKAPDQSKVRGLTEEGGRLVLSGSNGWAFFDYHLAMFGPQEVNTGPSKFVFAQPPYGCDPNAYTVRVTNATVGILRGGGCSFGIKVINAQKLGATAVVIINTDDQKTMRLMALPDEVPLVKIPCVMVSRRLQFYFESQLKRFPPDNHFLVSLQPTGVFGDYEKKNTLVLPQRLDNMK